MKKSPVSSSREMCHNMPWTRSSRLKKLLPVFIGIEVRRWQPRTTRRCWNRTCHSARKLPTDLTKKTDLRKDVWCSLKASQRRRKSVYHTWHVCWRRISPKQGMKDRHFLKMMSSSCESWGKAFMSQKTANIRCPCRVMSVYDSLGLLAPVVLVGKEILQELCRGSAEWDDPLSENLGVRWERRRSDLQDLESLSIMRFYKPTDFDMIQTAQVYHFSDASSHG